jgi:DNA-binding NarL/FixJ family response regulator
MNGLSSPPIALMSAPGRLRGRIIAELEQLGAVLASESLAALRAAPGEPELLVLAATRDGRALYEQVTECRRQMPTTAVVVIHDAARERTSATARLLRAGAVGIVAASELEHTLAPTLAAVRAGLVCVPGRLEVELAPASLSRREKQTIGLVTLGLSNGEIARQLHLTESTVKSHLTGAYRKLGVASRAEAADRLLDPTAGLGTGILTLTPREP